MTVKSALTTAATSTKKAWDKSKGTIAVVATLTTVGVITIALRAGAQFNAFLDEKGLSEEYYFDADDTPALENN